MFQTWNVYCRVMSRFSIGRSDYAPKQGREHRRLPPAFVLTLFSHATGYLAHDGHSGLHLLRIICWGSVWKSSQAQLLSYEHRLFVFSGCQLTHHWDLCYCETKLCGTGDAYCLTCSSWGLGIALEVILMVLILPGEGLNTLWLWGLPDGGSAKYVKTRFDGCVRPVRWWFPSCQGQCWASRRNRDLALIVGRAYHISLSRRFLRPLGAGFRPHTEARRHGCSWKGQESNIHPAAWHSKVGILCGSLSQECCASIKIYMG